MPPMRIFIAVLLLAASSIAAAAAGTDARTRRTIAALARQFDTHALIMLGELHRGKETHAFLQRMLHDPRFICRADDVVVEFGNSRLQPLADAYAAGDALSEAQLRSLWRETAVPLTWNAPMYAQVYETLRDINRRHLCTHAVRIVLGDPPLDWSAIHDAKEYAVFDKRDESYAAVVEREVLAKHHHALLIAGRLHAMKTVPADFEMGPDDLTVAQRIEQRHPGVLFSVITVPLASGAQALQMGAAPSFRVVHGSELENAAYQLTDYASTITSGNTHGKPAWKAEPDKHWPRMGEVVDGLLYLGGNTSVYPPPSIYLDPVYQTELRRRAQIIKDYSGQDFLTVIDSLVKEAEQARDTPSR
jgi:hypothetical protein